MVTIKLFAAARAAAGTSVVNLEASNLEEIFHSLSAINPVLAKLLPSCTFLINSEACSDFSKVIQAGAQIDVLPQFSGG